MLIQNTPQYRDYEFECISSDVLAKLRSLEIDNKHYERQLYKLEFYLQITNQQLTMEHFSNGHFLKVSEGFLGALNSTKLKKTTFMSRYEVSMLWIKTIAALQSHFPNIVIQNVKPHTEKTCEQIQPLIADFESIELKSEKIHVWNGWVSRNRKGDQVGLAIYPIYKRLGFEFANHLFIECDTWIRARKANSVAFLSLLSKFIKEYPGDISPSSFQCQSFMTKFWRSFVVFYFSTLHSKSKTLYSASKTWSSAIRFIEDHLIPSGLIAETWGPLPNPGNRSVKSKQSNIRLNTDGKEFHKKLLTDIPLLLTDESAILALFKKIEDDLGTIVAWADIAKKQIWEKYLERDNLAARGTPRLLGPIGINSEGDNLTSPSNPERFANAAATLYRNGYGLKTLSERQKLYPKPLRETAKQLGLPVTGSLLPHCIILVAHHPEITPSFLKGLELYDKNEKLVGLRSLDDGYVLVGYKDRKGSATSQQIVVLNPTTIEIVQQVISITNILRSYLRELSNDDWRYLFLCSGHSLSGAYRVKDFNFHSDQREKIFQELKLISNREHTDLLDLTDNLTLIAIRASAAAIVFLETLSVSKMSKALGHEKYDRELIRRYLPDLILNFFQERWIRIFQMGIVVEALKNSEHLLAATGFSSMDEIHQFLTNHTLEINCFSPRSAQPAPPSNQSLPQDKKIFIGVNEEILTVLLSLQHTAELHRNKVDSRVMYWGSFSNALTKHIESPLSGRADIKAYLAVAKRNAAQLLVPGVLLETE